MENVDVVNRALQTFGKRTTITSTQLTNESNNEAKQANLILEPTRRQLLRMAPWNCGMKFANLDLITAAPGTNENSASTATRWVPGLPPPPWIFEYQYPVDCLKPCWLVPMTATGATIDGVPIYPVGVTTGNMALSLQGPMIRFKVATDEFVPVTSALVAAGGTGYVVGDIITLADTPAGSNPIGAPARLRVATLAGSAVATVSVVNQVLDASPAQGGSYFAQQANPVAQGSTTGVGTGATFTLSYAAKATQRVILTNQQDAILAYVKDQVDLNVMDDLFQEAWINVLAAGLSFALTGDKGLANQRIQMANIKIEQARTADGNEGPVIDDRTPDWIRVRGYSGDGLYNANGPGFDWGPMWPSL
jgi:hypothetical protein